MTMNRKDIIIYALECLACRDRLDIERYREMIAQGEAKQVDFDWLNFHLKRRDKIQHIIEDIQNGQFCD